MKGIDIQAFERFLFLKRGRSEGGIRTALGHLRAISGWFDRNSKKLNQVSVEEFFVEKKKEGLANGTLIAYRTIFRLLEKFLSISLLEDIHLPEAEQKIPNILTTEEVRRLLAVELPVTHYGMYSTGQLNEVYKGITELLYFTGCRIDEALSLKRKQLLAGSLVHFVKTKNAAERLVFVYPPCYERLIKLAEDYPDTLVFRNMKDNKIHGVEFRKKLKLMAKLAGITKPIHPHLLRHTLATHLTMNKVDVRVIQQILGHKDLNSTMYYTQMDQSLKTDAIYALPLAQSYLTPTERIKRGKAIIEKLGFKDDGQFEYRLEETSRYGKKGLIFELFEK